MHQEHISFSIIYQTTQSSRTKIPYYTPSQLSNPIIEPLSISPLHIYIQHRHFCFANINSTIYGLFLQKLLVFVFLYRLQIHQLQRNTQKYLLKGESCNCSHTEPCPNLTKDKNTFYFSNTGWKVRQERTLFSPKISQE